MAAGALLLGACSCCSVSWHHLSVALLCCCGTCLSCRHYQPWWLQPQMVIGSGIAFLVASLILDDEPTLKTAVLAAGERLCNLSGSSVARKPLAACHMSHAAAAVERAAMLVLHLHSVQDRLCGVSSSSWHAHYSAAHPNTCCCCVVLCHMLCLRRAGGAVLGHLPVPAAALIQEVRCELYRAAP